MAELRVGVIGAGAMGANHVRVLRALPGASLVAIADTDEARLTAITGGERGYTDYQRLLDEEALDAVSIAVPTRLHVEVGLACIERGVPVLVEKPLAAAVNDGDRLRAAAAAASVPLMVGQVERFNPAVQALKQRVDRGDAGRIIQLSARRVGPFFQRGRDVGVVHDLATHDIDVFRYLLGTEVERVQAETQSGLRTQFEDALDGLLRFEGGALGLLEVNWLTPVKVRTLTVLGEGGMFAVDYLTQELRSYEAAGDVVQAKPRVDAFPGAGEMPLRSEFEAFLRVARGIEQPSVTAADSLATMRVADALVESAHRGEVVRLAVGRPS